MVRQMICIFTIHLLVPLITESAIVGESTQYIQEDTLAKFRSDDYSKLTTPLYVGGRVMDLMNGEHFDNILQDTPDHMRPPAILLFYDPTDSPCLSKYNSMDFIDNVQYKLPSRAFLFAAKYDTNAAPQRLWNKWLPERDLTKRFGITTCPSLVWLPSSCNGWTKWCSKDVIDGVEYLGCDAFVEQCTHFEIFDGPLDASDNWLNWVNDHITASAIPSIGGSRPKHTFVDHKDQEGWIKGRDSTTTRTQLRNNWAAASLPAFSDKGYKALKMPDALWREYIDFYIKHRSEKKDENWNSHGQTQVNGHEVAPYMTTMDLDMPFRDRIANEYIKPMLEEWVGFPLQLTSHYGLREYYSGSWLRNHIDRIDVLVISATSSLLHIRKNETDTFDGTYTDSWPDQYKGTWPLEGVDWKGNQVRYAHEPGTIVLYESAKFVHGRPYPLPGDDLVHVGAFCHFVPADGSWARAKHDKNARNNINRHTQNVRYTKAPLYYPPRKMQENKDEL